MKHFKPYLKTIKWILVFVPLMLAPLVFNHIDPWIGIVWAILSIVFAAHQIINSLTK